MHAPKIFYTIEFIWTYLEYTNVGYFLKQKSSVYTASRREMNNVKSFYDIK